MDLDICILYMNWTHYSRMMQHPYLKCNINIMMTMVMRGSPPWGVKVYKHEKLYSSFFVVAVMLLLCYNYNLYKHMYEIVSVQMLQEKQTGDSLSLSQPCDFNHVFVIQLSVVKIYVWMLYLPSFPAFEFDPKYRNTGYINWILHNRMKNKKWL